jgi:hypothetical protein
VHSNRFRRRGTCGEFDLTDSIFNL